jgi:uncharacterized protein YciI
MLYAVIQERGPNWDSARTLREQPGWPEHAAFIDGLAEDGFVVLAGPLSDESDFHRALLIVESVSEDEVHERLAADPWRPMEMLTTAAVYRWTVLIGEVGDVRG